MPGDEIFDSIRLRRDSVDFTQWPKLSCGDANQLDLDASSLRLDGDRSLQFQGNGQIRTAGTLRLFTDTSPTEKLTILPNGNVGISNVSPTTKLEVSGTVKATTFQGDGSTLTGIVQKAGDTITGSLAIQNNLTVQGNLDLRSLQFQSNGQIRTSGTLRLFTDTSSTEKLTILPNGNIGIGTDDPKQKLDVAGNIKSNGTRTYLQGVDGAGFHWIMAGGDQEVVHNRIGLNSNGNIVLRPSGNMGMGTVEVTGGIGFANQNAVDKKLYSPVDGLLEWMTHNAAPEHSFAVSHQGERRVYFSTQGNSYLNGGSFGIGTTAPQQKLHITGGHVQIEENRSFGLNISDKFSYDNKDIGHYSLGWFSDSEKPGAATAWLSGWAGIKLFTGGSLRFSIDNWGNTRYIGSFQASSRELKETITDFSVQEAVNTLEGLNPITYYLKADEEKHLRLGFIAEEVPDLVASHDRKAISTDHIVTVLTKVVKEQQKAIAALTEKVRILETQKEDQSF